ncbi:MAG: hypothetical protein IPJ50_16875 [Betaproteobacteria bacterium]|nr:hypothetical protein [Betaproteobacteria bacterium]
MRESFDDFLFGAKMKDFGRKRDREHLVVKRDTPETNQDRLQLEFQVWDEPKCSLPQYAATAALPFKVP